jgi:RHS repeat-associated protein
VASAQSASYNSLNQLTNLSGQAFTFDADGNLTSDGQRTYTWDAENRLVAIAYPGHGGKATTFAYDGLGRRIQTASTPMGGGNAVTINYLWCDQVLCQARNASNQVIKGYYAEGEYAPGGLGQSNYYAPDKIGSVRRVFTTFTSPSYDFDAYGAALQTTAPVTDFGYAGMVTNTDSGLYLTTHRPYDPVTGRFLIRDPIGEAGDPLGNLYAYVGGDPVDGVDPGGWWQVTIQVGAGVGGRLTFGNNGGQWNLGGYIGVGEGLSGDLDPYDRGCKEPGVNFGVEAQGEFGAGPHVEAEAHAFGREPWWNVNFGLPGTPLGGSIGTDGVTVPTIGVGESAVIGVGGTTYFH